MTIFPQAPNLTEGQRGLMVLQEPHLTIVKLGLGFSLIVLIDKGFETDGATVPEDELKKSEAVEWICKKIAKHYPGKDYRETLDFLIGTPFERPRILAALVHDALYGRKWKTRWLCDFVYRRILSVIKYDEVRLGIEYSGIRLVGKKNWDAVTDWERVQTSRMTVVRIVRTRNVPSEVSKLFRGKQWF